MSRASHGLRPPGGGNTLLADRARTWTRSKFGAMAVVSGEGLADVLDRGSTHHERTDVASVVLRAFPPAGWFQASSLIG